MQYAAPPRTRRRSAFYATSLVALLAAGCTSKPELGPDPQAEELGRAVSQQGIVAPQPAPPPAKTCGSDAWTTYGHDAARTSASKGCVDGPLRAAWTFTPRSVTGAPTVATRAVVAGDAVYVAGAIGPTPSLWRVDVRDGKPLWSYDSHTEAPRGGWPTLDPQGAHVFLIDDGVNGVDTATGDGKRVELDAWGESVSDGERLYAENTWYLDGYGLYLSAFDANLSLLWRRDYNALVKGVQVPDVGGLALDRGMLVHAAQHGALKGSGLSGFDPKTGERKWRAKVSPQSSPSLADGRVYAVERWPGDKQDRLVARSLDDGGLVWAQPVRGARGPAPVLANDLVIVHGDEGVVATERTTGTRVWTSPVTRTATPVQSATTLAAALGSGTLAVVSGASVHVLRLDDGAELWSGAPVAGAHRLDSPVVAGRSLYVVADSRVVRLESDVTAGDTAVVAARP